MFDKNKGGRQSEKLFENIQVVVSRIRKLINELLACLVSEKGDMGRSQRRQLKNHRMFENIQSSSGEED